TGEPAADITVIATDGTNDTIEYTTTVAANGTWSILDIDVSSLDDGIITFDVTMTDVGGNTTTDSVTAEKDTVAPIVDLTAVTNPINAAGAAATTASGTGEAGASISVVASDGSTTTTAVTTTVAGAGTWSVSNIDVSELDDGTITYSVTATDAAGNSSTDTLTAEMDTVAPDIDLLLVTDPVFSGNVATTAASGTGEVGASIVLVVSDGTNSTADLTTTVAGDGTWSIIDIDLTDLDDGTITYTVTATDAVDNAATDTLNAVKDVVANAAFLSATNPINANNVTAVSTIGTGEDGADIELVISDGANPTSAMTTTVAGGMWSFSGIDLSALDDGPITYTVTTTDVAGNTSTIVFNADKDTVVPVVDLQLVIDPVNAANASATSAGGSGEVGATISLTVTDGTLVTSTYTGVVAGDGNWVIVDIDVSTLNDGTITYSVTATDAAGNVSAPDTLTAEKDTVAPAVEITLATDPIDPGNETDASASGTGEVGATIVLFVTDGSNNTIDYNTIVAGDGTWAFTGIDVSGLDDGTITYTVTATDAAGNSAIDTLDADKDSIADILAANEDGFGDPLDTEFAQSGEGFAESVDSAFEDELSWLA
ncbi:MAG: Ig-like domain-containing protein, partial [Pirellulales bacterium]